MSWKLKVDIQKSFDKKITPLDVGFRWLVIDIYRSYLWSGLWDHGNPIESKLK
jgi:hypothetical protein